ncbi:hypothetical protein [Rhizobium phage RHEph12]|nr:hypothetical protein [Rhizobium phage RHEph12]
MRREHRRYSQGWDAFVSGLSFEPNASESWCAGYSDALVVEATCKFADPKGLHERHKAFALHPQGNPHWQHVDDMREHYRQGRTRYRAVLFDVILWAVLLTALVAAIVLLTNSFIAVRVPPVTYHDRFGAITWNSNSNPISIWPSIGRKSQASNPN